MRPFHRAAATAAAAILLLGGGPAGCSMLDGSDSSEGSSAGASGVTVEGGEAAVDTVGEAIVKTTVGAPPQAPVAQVEIAVIGLKVRGRLATLTVQMTPRLPDDAENDTASPYELNGDEGLDPVFIDPVNLKRYVVVKDSRGRELQTDDIRTDLTDDRTGTLRFTFAAPPEHVKALDLQLGEWPTFRDIPVTR
ncbi:hypothetical protein BJF79_22055 [Actinomadura sp. CNU-125]|uniref:hypothetical protein n=1 Tax=Actinomadura sp. CNU-125 TaxID=1904961 RepID=UPI000965DEC9|nr:hypothetical protein [Actinomadura sp. CNU-125]OLT12522.1 hypothetical protein BJF79_22055 [Actinomadura sp. CNU-125]